MHRILLHLILHTNFTNFHFKKLSTLWMENFVTEVRCKKKKVIFNKTRFVEINYLFITMADFFNFFDEHKLPHHMN